MKILTFNHFFCTEAREAFSSQFTQLESSVHVLQLQLHDFATLMNCSLLKEKGSTSSEEENRMLKAKNECQVLMDTFAAVTETQAQLQKMTLDLNSLVSMHNVSSTHIIYKHFLSVSVPFQSIGCFINCFIKHLYKVFFISIKYRSKWGGTRY